MLVVQLSAQFICQPAGTPTVVNGALTLSDPLQTGRVARDGNPSSCTGKKNSLQNTMPVRHDVQVHTNPTGMPACVTVDVNFNGCNFNSTAIAAYSAFNAANPAAGLIGDLGYSTFDSGSFSFPVATDGSFTVVVHEIDAGSGCPAYSYTVSYSTRCRQPGFDAENDGKANLALFRPSLGDWSVASLDAVGMTDTHWGANGDRPTAADYSGDGITDLSVFRPSQGVWYSLLSPNGTVTTTQWGIATDVPVSGDYDRDGKADVAVWRPSSGEWYILRSSDQTFQVVNWGLAGDKPVPGDYDGDRRNDLAVYRPNQDGVGVWYVLLSNFNYGFFTGFQWGLPTDKPVPADYDGDANTDIAVYRPSDAMWYIYLSAPSPGGPIRYERWGLAEDIPQPADYDGDKRADVAVWRPSDRKWYVLASTDGIKIKAFGETGDVPATASFVTQLP